MPDLNQLLPTVHVPGLTLAIGTAGLVLSVQAVVFAVLALD